jgi:sugar O-acyltransferase (sialic acid O-acetyltransferase NeuD family)
MQPAVIIGAGGHAREVLDVLDAVNASKPTFEILGYIVEPAFGRPGEIVNDCPILGGFDWFVGRESQVKAICAVGAPALRRRLAERALGSGIRFLNAIHPEAHFTRWVTFGEGVVITAGCILTNQIRVGSHVHVNIGCTVSHNNVLEDFATLAPGVHSAGNVRFREGCDIGVGASIIPKIEIGAWSIVGAGAVVIRDVPPNSTVAGVPATELSIREAGWQLR